MEGPLFQYLEPSRRPDVGPLGRVAPDVGGRGRDAAVGGVERVAVDEVAGGGRHP